MLSAFAQKLKVYKMIYDTNMFYTFSFCAKVESIEQKLLFESRMLSTFAITLSAFVDMLSVFAWRYAKAESTSTKSESIMLSAFAAMFSAFAWRQKKGD